MAEQAASSLDAGLRFLVRRHPRPTWQTHANLGEVARFWLHRHALFRELDRLIRDGIAGALDGRMDAASFRPWLHRHLGLFLWQLDEHHAVEDQHYFPLFRRAEPKLSRGFEILERDHDALHQALEGLAERADAVLRPDLADPAAFRRELGRLADAHTAIGPNLLRHLDDEEDLVVPLILEQGERALFGRA